MLCRLFKQAILEPELYGKALRVPDCLSACRQRKHRSLRKRIVLPSPLSWPCDSPSFMQPPDLVNRSESSCWKKPAQPAGAHRRETARIKVTNLRGLLAKPWWSKACVTVFQ